MNAQAMTSACAIILPWQFKLLQRTYIFYLSYWITYKTQLKLQKKFSFSGLRSDLLHAGALPLDDWTLLGDVRPQISFICPPPCLISKYATGQSQGCIQEKLGYFYLGVFFVAAVCIFIRY